jgi:glycosyltransferase involved in cell wall biosynthesis
MFQFYKFIAPTWYHRLPPKKSFVYFLDYRKLPNEVQAHIDLDHQYKSEAGKYMDAAFQAWNRGVMLNEPQYELKITGSIPLADEYRFVKKYFNPFFAWYIFFIQFLTLRNPIGQLLGMLQSLGVKRLNLYQKSVPLPSLREGHFPLFQSNPLVTVIIPTLNRYTYLKDVFRDLEKQTYTHFEVIVVDQTSPSDPSVFEGWNLDLKVIYQEEKALWLARNTAIQQSKGDWILLYDDDSLVDPDWIENHLKCLDVFQCDISSGVSISTVGGKVPASYAYFKWSDQVDTGNVLLPKKIFREIGLFDRQFEKQRMGDGEFGLRAYLHGYSNVSNPLAKRVHLKVGEGGLRQMGSWDAFRTKSWSSPRPIPSVLYLTRKYFGTSTALYLCFQKIPLSVIPYQYKSNKVMALFAYPMAVILSPILIFQMVKSWRLATQKLKEGAKISHLQ